MKRLSLLAFGLFLQGCLATIHAPNAGSYDYLCASTGQVYEGFTATQRHSGNTYGEVRCRKPQNDQEACMVEFYNEVGDYVRMHNSKAKTRGLIIAGGYVLFYFPGAYLNEQWEPENRKSAENFVELVKSKKSECEGEAVAH